MDVDYLRRWVGRRQLASDTVTVSPVVRLAGLLDAPDEDWSEADLLPPLWHWLYFLPTTPQSQLADDGHPPTGGLLPPVPFERRMFAGGHVSFSRPIRLGNTVDRLSEVTAVDFKRGRSGPLVFVTVRHEFSVGGTPSGVEVQNLVYRSATQAAPTVRDERTLIPQGSWQWTVDPTAALLFRFSALTYNSHRIHYDRPYAMDIEGYPGLVVQGPLTAVLMLESVRRRSVGGIERFSFTNRRPLFDDDPFTIVGTEGADGSVDLATYAPSGELAATATALFVPS